jgi:hypothetical protein
VDQVIYQQNWSKMSYPYNYEQRKALYNSKYDALELKGEIKRIRQSLIDVIIIWEDDQEEAKKMLKFVIDSLPIDGKAT